MASRNKRSVGRIRANKHLHRSFRFPPRNTEEPDMREPPEEPPLPSTEMPVDETMNFPDPNDFQQNAFLSLYQNINPTLYTLSPSSSNTGYLNTHSSDGASNIDVYHEYDQNDAIFESIQNSNEHGAGYLHYENSTKSDYPYGHRSRQSAKETLTNKGTPMEKLESLDLSSASMMPYPMFPESTLQNEIGSHPALTLENLDRSIYGVPFSATDPTEAESEEEKENETEDLGTSSSKSSQNSSSSPRKTSTNPGSGGHHFFRVTRTTGDRGVAKNRYTAEENLFISKARSDPYKIPWQIMPIVAAEWYPTTTTRSGRNMQVHYSQNVNTRVSDIKELDKKLQKEIGTSIDRKLQILYQGVIEEMSRVEGIQENIPASMVADYTKKWSDHTEQKLMRSLKSALDRKNYRLPTKRDA